MTGRRSTAWRVALACLLVALLAVLVSSVVTLVLVDRTARQVTQEALAQQADVVARQLDAGVPLAAVEPLLRGQDIAVVALPDPVADPVLARALERAGAARALAGRPVSAVVTADGTGWVVEARPAAGSAFALVRAPERGPLGSPLLGRTLGFALLAGSLAAILVGAGAGTVLARPLRRTARAARELADGARDVRVPVRGPAEVADVAAAVNELADALARSEGRQRRFLLSVSHELRTPLTAVRGLAESLADGVVTGDDVPGAGEVMVREALRLDRLVADLIDLARLEADDVRVDLQIVDPVALVDEAAEVWRGRCAGAGIAFRTETAPDVGPVLADPRRLRQVLDGFAENAVRVVPPGAALVFAVHGDGAVEVRDGGPGLAPEDYPVAFERGLLHDRYDGRRPVGLGGIGLALAHGLVTRMGGTVTAGPAPEGGACFTVRLAAAGPAHGPGASPGPRCGLR
ncbi:HAMP domain-containing sensor histidine kinase [Pseudonocardia sp. ICBG162]|uniref:sensor histidine kinase n=1 Tax=Pseudonocardia sp. ICBG162 TaxID=2846761 RepID=UPI001CF605D9|nr:HAMP domain-containing sensor histidine kinase [Pseudonocardia sp. ICBG162]